MKQLSFILIPILASVNLLTCVGVQAGSVNSWTGGNGNYYWQQDGNWSDGHAPNSSYSWIYLTNTSPSLVVVHSYIPSNTLTMSNLALGAPPGVTNTLSIGYVVTGYPPFTLTDGPFEVLNELDINSGGKLWISCLSTTRVDSVSGGYFTVSGIAQMDDGLLVTTNATTEIGQSGSGNFTMNGGLWQAGYIRSGSAAGRSGTLTMNGGNVSASILHIGASGSTGMVCVTGGQLTVATNAYLYVGFYGTGTLVVSNGTVSTGEIIVPGGDNTSAGTVLVAGGTLSATTLDQGPNGIVSFPAGTILAQSAYLIPPFSIGDGSRTAQFVMQGGEQNFGGGLLRVCNNATLSGCGNIEGFVNVDPGGTWLADCGGTVSCEYAVTNNGTIRATNGSTIEVSDILVNNGTIDVINGSLKLDGSFINNGTLLDASSVSISHAAVSGADVTVRIPSAVGHTYQLQWSSSLSPAIWTPDGSQAGNGSELVFTDSGGATNSTARFYRVSVSAP